MCQAVISDFNLQHIPPVAGHHPLERLKPGGARFTNVEGVAAWGEDFRLKFVPLDAQGIDDLAGVLRDDLNNGIGHPLDLQLWQPGDGAPSIVVGLIDRDWPAGVLATTAGIGIAWPALETDRPCRLIEADDVVAGRLAVELDRFGKLIRPWVVNRIGDCVDGESVMKAILVVAGKWLAELAAIGRCLGWIVWVPVPGIDVGDRRRAL